VRGFFADLVGRIGVPEVADRLLDAVERELARNMGVVSAGGPGRPGSPA